MHIILDLFRDLPAHLTQMMQIFGAWTYVVLFAVIFAETGFIVTPILPGDSLLFAVGAMTALDGGLELWTISILLILAAVTGNIVNYSVGRWMSGRFFGKQVKQKSAIFNPKYLERTQKFYLKHGGKTMFLTRFMPILRTYAPFVAGLSQMPYGKFLTFNLSGAVAWVGLFIFSGHYFGNMPEVKANFHYVILAIIVVSFIPAAVEFARARVAGAGQSKTS